MEAPLGHNSLFYWHNKVFTVDRVDEYGLNLLSSITNSKQEVQDASILYEVSRQKGNEGRQGNNHEEWKAGNPGCVSHMWDKDVQDRKELRAIIT